MHPGLLFYNMYILNTTEPNQITNAKEIFDIYKDIGTENITK